MAKRMGWARGQAFAAGRMTHSIMPAARVDRGQSTCRAWAKRTGPAILVATGLLVWLPGSQSYAAESAFSAYGLGTSAFSAGETPPPGTYVSAGLAYITGDIEGNLTFGGIEIDVAMEIRKFVSGSANLLYVPEQTFLGGRPGISMTVPFGFIDIAAQVTGPLGNTVELQTDGWGLGDMVPRLQLGFDNGDFHHTFYVQALLPTGRYETGFNPNIGLNRPAIDFGWAFTYIEPTSKLQFNATFGLTTSFENEATDYDSGDDFHVEWAVGRDFGNGLLLGVVGYNYRQLSDDTGAGVPAILNGFKGDVDAIGPGLTYTTQIGKIPFIFNARHYEEFNVHKRFDNSVTIITGTFVF
jgi:hypothetical protein